MLRNLTYLIIGAFLCVCFSACVEEEAPSPRQATNVKAKPAAKSVAPPQEAVVEKEEDKEDEFIYVSEGRRDPFMPLSRIKKPLDKVVDEEPQTPLQSYDVAQYKLIGVIVGMGDPKAMALGRTAEDILKASGLGEPIRKNTVVRAATVKQLVLYLLKGLAHAGLPIDPTFTTTIVCENVSDNTGPVFGTVTVEDTSGMFEADWYPDPVNGTDCTVTMVPNDMAVEGSSCSFSFDIGDDHVAVEVFVDTVDRTGVEMEALHACSTAALTIYDMCKSADRGMTIGELALWEKTGGRSGTYRRVEE